MKNKYKYGFQFPVAVRFLFVLSVFFLLTGMQPLFSQGMMCLGLGGGADDAGYSLVQADDGGYVIAGDTKSYGAGGSDVYIVKLDSMGVQKWTRTVGGSGNDYARSIIKTKDGGYVVCGYTNSYGAGGNDVYVIKLDAAGTVLWTRTVGGTKDEIGWQIIQTSDGGYAVGGTSNSFGLINDMYLLKLDSSGTKKWDSRITRGNIACNAYSITQAPDGGYVLCGTTPGKISSGMYSPDWYIVKVDSGTHNLLWSRVIVPYPGKDYYTQANRVISTADGGFLVTGYGSQPKNGGYTHDMFVAKLFSNGTLDWSSFYGGIGISSGNNDDEIKSVIQTADGGYVLAGFSRSFGALYIGSNTIYIVKIDGTGNMLWNKVIGTKTADGANDIIQTTDGGFAVTGFTLFPSGAIQNMAFVKLDNNMNSACCEGTGGAPSASSPSTTTIGSSSTASGAVVQNSGASGSGGVPTNNTCGLVIPPPTAAFTASDDIICANGCINFTDLSAYATSWKWEFPGGLPSSSTLENPIVCYVTPGNYDVNFWAYNSSGSDSSKITNRILVLDSPPIPYITQSNDTLYCTTDSSYVSYQWFDGSTLVVGAVDTFFVVQNDGNYNVQVKNSNDCSVAVGINVVLGIKDVAVHHGTSGLLISPNPAAGELTVSGYATGERGVVEIYNVLGESIYQHVLDVGSSSFKLYCGSFASGIYYISIKGEHGRLVDRFVKE